MNLFETATKFAYRFNSSKGALTTEQLWDLPLTSNGGFDLNSIAKGINKMIREAEEDNFVGVQANSELEILKNKLEIVKFIIADKQAEKEAARVRSAKAEERKKILEVLAGKQSAALQSMSEADLLARLEAL